MQQLDFHPIFAQKIPVDCRYTLQEYLQSIPYSINKEKIMYTPVHHSFNYIKRSARGYKSHGCVILMQGLRNGK